MGLDISVYGGCKRVEPELDEDGEATDFELARVYINPDFPAQADDLVDMTYYEAADSNGFRAGSYGGYNRWRNELAQLAGYTDEDAFSGKVTAGPFFELVNFSDCEGTIGPKTSAKLAGDFALFEGKAAEAMDQYSLQLYREWKAAFEMAAQDGFVSFH